VTEIICGGLTSIVVFTDVAVVVVAVPNIDAKCLSLVVVKWSKTFIPSALEY